MTRTINRRTAIAVAATAALCAGCYAAFAASDADYQRDRGIMQRPSASQAASQNAQAQSTASAQPAATAPAQDSQAAPGSSLSQNAAPAAQHSFSPQNGSQQAAAGDQNTVKSLLKQAHFWHDKYQPAMAAQSLNRVLLADPDNADALYLLSLWASETGDSEGAERYRRRLEVAHPRDSRLQSLQNEKDLSKLSKDQLHRARQLAASGNIPGALQAYRQLFPNGNVPRSLMNEYYLTMSGDPSMQQQALQGVASYIRQNPTDTDAKITYGKLLSYNEQTREAGIEVLDYYAGDSQDADKALRQALVWLTPTEQSEKYYRNYLNRHPNDTEVRNRFATAVADQMNQSAYSSFRSQNTAQAKAQFEDVLKRDPNNAVALEGLGYLLQATGDYQQASDYLSRASSVNRDLPKKQKLAYDAQFAKARALEKAGDLQGAENAADTLEKLPGGDAKALNLYRASVERKLKLYQKAEDHLRAVLADDPSNKAAGEMLYYTLKDAGKSAEAKAAAASLPQDLREAIAKREAVPPDPAAGLRRQAQSALASGDEAGAIAALERAASLKPSDPWIRHDLADVLHRAHRDAEAREQLSRLLGAASPAALFAAATLQSKWGDLKGASDTMSRIPASYNAKGVSDLRRSLTLRAGMADAESYLASGNKAAALNTLQGLERNASGMQSPDLGHLAYLFLKAGDSAKARMYADRAVAGGISPDASLGDYADTVSVYNELGLYDRARAITGNQSLLANSDPSALAAMRNGDVIRQADRLRTLGRSADAYDLLYGALQQSPQDPDLMCAMGRIYQDNNRLDEAEVIFDRAFTMSPDNEGALKGAINVALANNHEEKALALSQRLESSQDPDTLYLKARVAAGNHQYRQAITYLRQTKSMLEGSPYIADPLATGAAAAPLQASATHAYNNPFRNDHELTARNQTNTPAMPWEASNSTTTAVDPASAYMFNTDEISRRRTLNDVDKMLREMYDITATRIELDASGRQKDGEDGLSKVNEIRGTVAASTPVFDDNRLTASVTVGAMKAGKAKPDSNRKFGTNPLGFATQALVNSLNSLNDAAKAAVAADAATAAAGGTGTAVSNLAASMNMSASAITALAGRGHTSYAEIEAAADNSAATASLLQEFGFGSGGHTALEQIYALIYNYHDDTYGMHEGGSLSDQGAEVNLALSGRSYRADIGSSPLGKDNSTIVGGLYLFPKVTPNTELRLNLERRAVNDSVLSYYGVKDNYSGMFFGGVTKNGGSVGFAWDNGSYGAYGDVRYYFYRGENVMDNHMWGAGLGAYARSINNSVQQLQVGVDFQYMDYQHNENHFTAGYGGYFSPQDYYSIAIPVNWKRIYNQNLELQLGASIGYQSYTNEGGAYFPTDGVAQSTLQTLADWGLAPEATFGSEDKDGISGSLRLGVDYRFNDAFSISGNINYNTFGEYKEANEMLSFKYLTGIDSYL